MPISYVAGTGAWMPGCPNVAAVLTGPYDGSPDDAPACGDLSSRLGRGTSLITRMANEAASQALVRSGFPPESVLAVSGSAYGEIQIAIDQLHLMNSGDGRISPAMFKNSVHNTAVGVFSIAHGNRKPSTALAAGRLTTAYALLEGQALLAEGAQHVLVILADERLPGPLASFGEYEPFAAAFALSNSPVGPGPHVGIEAIVRGAHDLQPPSIPEAIRDNPCAAAWLLLRAVEQRRPGRLALGGLADLGDPSEEAWYAEVVLDEDSHDS